MKIIIDCLRGCESYKGVNATLCLVTFDLGAAADQTARLEVIVSLLLVLFNDYFKIGCSLDHLGMNDLSADRRMLAMIVEHVEETMHPDTALESVSVFLADKVLHLPRESLECDLGLFVDRVRTREGGIGGEHDDLVIVLAGDGTNTGLESAAEELVECLPSVSWPFSLIKTERRRIPKR